MHSTILTIEDLIDHLGGIGENKLQENLAHTHYFMFLLKAIVDLNIDRLGGKHQFVVFNNSLRNFDETDVVISGNRIISGKVDALFDCCIEASFENAIEACIVKSNVLFILKTINDERNQSLHLENMYRCRRELALAFRRASEPQIEYTVVDKPSVGKRDFDKVKIDDLSTVMVHMQIKLCLNYGENY